MNNDLQSVKATVPWQAIITSAGYKVAKDSGDHGTAHCQFHGEDRTASIYWHEEKGWYCHGCQTGGDKISFLEHAERCDFKKAKQILYQLAGVPLPKLKPRLPSYRDSTEANPINHHLLVYRQLQMFRSIDQAIYRSQKTRISHDLECLRRKKTAMNHNITSFEIFSMQKTGI